MQLISYVIFIFFITLSAPSMAAEKLFGKDFTESCIQGAIDAQLKNGTQATKPARASAMCLCLGDELNKTVIKEDMNSALKGDTEQLDVKQRAAVNKCVAPQKSNTNNQKKSERLQSVSNWVYIGGIDKDDRKDSIDTNSIRTDKSGLIRIWVKQEYSLPQKTPYGEIFAENKASVALNCLENKAAVTTIDYFETNGKLIREIAIKPSEWSFSESPPDSLRGSLLHDYCKP